jgi:hypothetical protein
MRKIFSKLLLSLGILTLTLPFWITKKIGNMEIPDVSLMKIPITILLIYVIIEIVFKKDN